MNWASSLFFPSSHSPSSSQMTLRSQQPGRDDLRRDQHQQGHHQQRVLGGDAETGPRQCQVAAVGSAAAIGLGVGARVVAATSRIRGPVQERAVAGLAHALYHLAGPVDRFGAGERVVRTGGSRAGRWIRELGLTLIALAEAMHGVGQQNVEENDQQKGKPEAIEAGGEKADEHFAV